MSSKYSKDFKLKVLEYYFEHGGDKKFGNKTRTASHFCIDHKTVSRMLRNPDIVKTAKKTFGKKSVGTENAKSSKSNHKNSQPYVSLEKVISPQQRNQNSSSSSSKSSQSSKKINIPQAKSEVPIIELPEDPDFSVLKSSIDSSVSSVSHVARLLITGNSEVKYIITNECDLIFECKVCRNLFRSVINFLAHKRNYCVEKYTNVRNLFHKDTHSNMTTESSTAFVEPEPPPTPAEGESSPSGISEALENTVEKAPLRKIDKIASQLVKKKEKSQLTSSSTDKGSSEYFKSIENVNNARKSVGSDCTVVLKDIKDVSTAVYQSVVSRNESSVSSRKTSHHQRKRERPVHLNSKENIVEMKEEEEDKSHPLTSQENVSVRGSEKTEEMEVDVSCNSCNSIFSSKKLLNAHIEETHGLEKMVYTCPICNVIFLSIWGCVKHLVRVHKKKRQHRDRLKHVICSRAYKKVFTPKEIAKHSHKSCAQISKVQDKIDDPSGGETTSQSAVSSSPVKENVKEVIEKKDSPEKAKDCGSSRVPGTGAEEDSPGFFRNKAPVLPNTCPRCFQSFSTPTAMGSHLQLCSFTPLSNSSETPEKKIAIQIRKDYQKDSTVIASPTSKESGSVSHALVSVKEEHQEASRSKNDENIVRKRIQERLNELCLVESLFCIPCGKKYNTFNVLKRHMSAHIGWTRFSCSECSFRHYERYVCIEHCMSVHKCKDKVAENLVIKEERITESKGKERINESKVKEIKRVSVTNDVNRKIDSLQNGDCTSSECSASIVSEDSLSMKSEFDSQETESADVAYRELIEKTDDVLMEVNNGIEIKTELSESPESSTLKSNNIHNEKTDENKVNNEKMDEKKLNNEKTDEKKLNNEKTDEKKLNNKKTDEKKLNNEKTDEKKLSNEKTDEKKLNNEKTDEKKLEVDVKSERPQRNRKIIEQKDFVYEPLRSPTVSFRPDENKIEGSTLVIQRQRIASGQTVILKIDRSSTKRKEFPTVGESSSKKTCARVLTDTNPHFSICNGQGGNATVIARTVVAEALDKSPKASADILVNKEPVESINSDNHSPTKLNISEQPVSSNREQVSVGMKIQVTGVKLKDTPDHGNRNDSIVQLRCQNSSDKKRKETFDCRVKTLAKTAKESLAAEKGRPIIVRKIEEEKSKSVNDSPVNENTLVVKENVKLMNVEHLISRLKKRINQVPSEEKPKNDSSLPTSDECINREISDQKKVTIGDPVKVNKQKSISVIQIQKQNPDRKRTLTLSQPTLSSSASVMTITASKSSSSSQLESKIKIKVDPKQDKEPNSEQSTKIERSSRKKSSDSKN